MSKTAEEENHAAWYQGWQRLRASYVAETRRLLSTALQEGRPVREEIGNGLVHDWPQCSPFLPQWNTADYLTEHLMSRHLGFGYTLVIDGVRRHP